MATYLWNVYVEIVQISYYSDRLILSYKESTRFTEIYWDVPHLYVRNLSITDMGRIYEL